ncbi:xanthine phosphoribosyltransferase [Buchnera aphidicola (Aphis craccivora)]|uniref:Xanthine-guanine phosphoribosyltransferase n=1 Tax=Buchnera aphidicola (Aphis craccivora) TaxID=466616 RepID=A0A4D6XPL8_9GAMM|nr:xanthine phosphoribosyltransferase [Buchnera aphidicola]QCI16500.1 xanthine phosphoribosyltransferase [Buchnera aphidicola (Aphis craccivora)]QLL40637.1 xanthine phosphoribosyltransferase [Buchnera aphidicola (Aphis craccivore)]WAI18011.1 MAG: xanthine phosphoribosyltransferase [Buchnera aphidicola (Aphis craccivora)]
MSEKYIVTWDMLQIYTRKLAKRLLKINSWNAIIAVSRGGLVPASLLARELGIRYVDTICIASYNYDCLQKNRKIIKKTKINSEKIIVVDDLVDTGGTANIIRTLYPQAYFVTIFAKPMGKLLVDDYIIDVDQNIWIEQPWDMSISYIPPLFKNN